MTQGVSPPTNQFDPGDRWVPVDRRWLGLDRATLLPAVVVLAFAFVLAAVLPAVNSAVEYDDTVTAGDVMEIAGGVTFEPATDWGITSGVGGGGPPPARGDTASATVEADDVSLTVRTGAFSGDARALLEQIRDTTTALDDSIHIDGTPTPVTTDSGEHGYVARYAGPRFSGVLAAFVEDGRGVQVVATGPPDTDQSRAEEISRMITSIDRDREES
jgi:hypothetical protein